MLQAKYYVDEFYVNHLSKEVHHSSLSDSSVQTDSSSKVMDARKLLEGDFPFRAIRLFPGGSRQRGRDGWNTSTYW